jgi:carboxyl-terminal processing protease
MRKKINVVALIMMVVALTSALALSEAHGEVERKQRDEWYKQVELFSDAVALIQSGYVDEVKPKDMIYGALKGMLESLDPHSQFLDPEAYADLRVETEGKFGGLGIEIAHKDGLLTVVTPLADTPAWDAGVKAQDRIVRIDGELTRDLSLTDAVKKMRGAPGSEVTITILRESEKRVFDVTIKRAIIVVKDIKDPMILQDGIAYIRLTEFREDTADDLEKVLKKLTKDGMDSLILDMRNNPGGLLESAVRVTEKFIPQGKMIVYTKGRQNSQQMEFRSKDADAYIDMPMVVLINAGSASGSEILAGALKDYKRAVIVGEKSYGKGSVQTVVPLGDGSALKLTTSKYFTPLGNVIHEKGVEPDIVVLEAVADSIDDEAKEEDIAKKVFEQLEGGAKAKDQEKAAQQVQKDAPADEKDGKQFDYKSDVQIMRGIDVIKVAKFYKQNGPDGKTP